MDLLKSPAFKIVIAGLALGGAAYLLYSSLGSSRVDDVKTRMPVIDFTTGELYSRSFRVESRPPPFVHPETGERTLVTAVNCHWTAPDGLSLEQKKALRDDQRGAKADPTYVMLIESLPREQQEEIIAEFKRNNPTLTDAQAREQALKTYCPDCGRETVLHNEVPPIETWVESGVIPPEE